MGRRIEEGVEEEEWGRIGPASQGGSRRDLEVQWSEYEQWGPGWRPRPSLSCGWAIFAPLAALTLADAGSPLRA